MAKTTHELMNILATGASVTMSARGKLSNELMNLAVTAKNGGGILTLTNCEMLVSSELLNIGVSGKNHVHFIL